MSLQEQIAERIVNQFNDAYVKKINKDNYLDIHLPFIHEKKGTHLFFNTSKDKMKIGFYCRDTAFIEKVIKSSNALETYSQGIRLTNNPSFERVEDVISAAIMLIHALQGKENSTFIEDKEQTNQIESLIIDEDFIGIFNDLIKTYKLLPNFSFIPEILRNIGYEITGNACWFYTENVRWAENIELWDLLITNDGFYSSMGQSEYKLLFDWDSLVEVKIKVADNHSTVTLGLFQEDGQFLSLTQKESISLVVVYYLYQHVVKLIIEEFRDQPMIIWSKVDELGILRQNFKSYQELYSCIE